jgi:hypothetical protein
MSGDHNRYQKGSVAQQQPESEPVAWMMLENKLVPIHTAPPQREWKYDPMTGEPLIDGWPLYSGLPQREWQGLTYKERNDCLVEADPCEALLDHEAHELMRTVEAKLKEKNGG